LYGISTMVHGALGSPALHNVWKVRARPSDHSLPEALVLALREGGKGENSRTPAAAVEFRSTKKRTISLSLPSPTAGDCRAAAPRRVNPRAQRPWSLWEKVGLFRHIVVCQVPLDRSVRSLDTKADSARLHSRAHIVAASARSRFLPCRHKGRLRESAHQGAHRRCECEEQIPPPEKPKSSAGPGKFSPPNRFRIRKLPT
jgi:hypothetical protein